MSVPVGVSGLLAPAVALILWTFVMEVWMYITRISAINKNKIVFNPTDTKDDFNKHIPPQTRWKADNYNHLHEQPTIFYAVIGVLAVAAASDPTSPPQHSASTLAWLYVALRIVHSFWQSLVNQIPTRFVLFVASSFILFLLSMKAAFAVLL